VKELLKTDHQAIRKCQAEMVKAGVGVDFFLAAPMGGYLDIATIGFASEKTGGETYYYPNWSYPRDCLRLEKELTHTVQREQGYAALMKVRCSNGLQIAHYTGNFTQHTFGADLELASVTEDTGMSVTFAYDGKVSLRLNPVASIEERRRATHVEVRSCPDRCRCVCTDDDHLARLKARCAFPIRSAIYHHFWTTASALLQPRCVRHRNCA